MELLFLVLIKERIVSSMSGARNVAAAMFRKGRTPAQFRIPFA
jgi:hypothetical protein